MAALVAVGMMVSVASAVDVTKLKIDGVGLGDSYDKIKQKLPCKNPSERILYKTYKGEKITSQYICEVNKDIGRELFVVNVDNHNKVMSIAKNIYFNTEPDFGTIKNQIKNTYGEPDYSSELINQGENEHKIMLGYGDDNCEVKQVDDGTDMSCYSSKKTTFSVRIWKHKYLNRDNRGSAWLTVQINDPMMEKKAEEYWQLRLKNEAIKPPLSSAQRYNSWTTGYVFKNTSETYAPFKYISTEINCANGTNGTVFNYYARDTSYRYIVNVTNSFKTFDEAANYICGNR